MTMIMARQMQSQVNGEGKWSECYKTTAGRMANILVDKTVLLMKFECETPARFICFTTLNHWKIWTKSVKSPEYVDDDRGLVVHVEGSCWVIPARGISQTLFDKCKKLSGYDVSVSKGTIFACENY